MQENQLFHQKAILITGAGRGIGKRLAIGYASRGAKVGLLARSKAELDLAHLEIEHAGGESIRLRADVRSFEEICAAADLMRVKFGAIHALVCSAGVQGPIGPFIETAPKAWIETYETNVFGVVNACRAVLPQMVERRSGKIIVISGGGAATLRPNFSAYASSKTAMVRFVETIAEEVADNNVQVNCMSPGGTYSNMTDEILRAGDRAGEKEIHQATQVRLTGGVAPEKQIQLAVFLASERSNHITGRMIHVNDDWKKLEHGSVHPELYTLRRVQRT